MPSRSRWRREWLASNGCRRYYFKYCSTFDSTARGNIGPVTDALMDALGADFTIATPAFPENGRTIFRGYLFVGDLLLSESGMKDHPLTPMNDANLVRVLQAQTRRKVGLVAYPVLARGADAVRERIAGLKTEGAGIAVVDALSQADLRCLAEACGEFPLVTAGSGLGLGIADWHRREGRLRGATTAATLPRIEGHAAALSGSCSTATNGQVAEWAKARPAFCVDPMKLAQGQPVVDEALAWAKPRLAAGPVLIYATGAPHEVKAVQAALGAETAGGLVEAAFAAIARGLVEAGVRRLVIAGGETSGAVVNALGVKSLRIGPQIDPGVPWTASLDAGNDAAPLALALKSGNFGTPDFFAKAFAQLDTM